MCDSQLCFRTSCNLLCMKYVDCSQRLRHKHDKYSDRFNRKLDCVGFSQPEIDLGQVIVSLDFILYRNLYIFINCFETGNTTTLKLKFSWFCPGIYRYLSISTYGHLHVLANGFIWVASMLQYKCLNLIRKQPTSLLIKYLVKTIYFSYPILS